MHHHFVENGWPEGHERIARNDRAAIEELCYLLQKRPLGKHAFGGT